DGIGFGLIYTCSVESEGSLLAIREWLPAFRAVAETEHLPTAARRLNMTVAELAQSIRLLEEAVGHALFTSVDRRLLLTPDGCRPLGAIQTAQRALARGVRAVSLEPMSGPLRISSLTILTDDFVLPSVLELKRRHPSVRPILVNEGPRDANELLA